MRVDSTMLLFFSEIKTKSEETSAVCERQNVLITFREARVGPRD